jgi:flagellar biosynthesis protein
VIHKDAALAEDLTRLDIGEHIPPDLYEAVAKILVFISDLDRAETMRKRNIEREMHT